MFSFFKLGKKPGPTLGLEITSNALSFLQIEKTKTDIRVAKFASMPMPPDLVREGLLADPEAVGALLRDLLDGAGFTQKGPKPTINIAIPGQAVVIRLMPVPVGMPPDELSDVVRQEAINNLPFPIDEANIDFSLLSATERTDPDGVRRVDVILAAIQRIVVESYHRMAEAADVEVGRLDISALSAVRALGFSEALNDETQLSMAVNVRWDATDITLVRNGMPLFSRSVLLGVETLLEAISRSIDAPIAEVQSLLPRMQLGGVPTADPRIGQAAQVARSVFGDLTAEVGRSLEFYMSQVGHVSVDQILLCGPGCAIPEVAQFVSNRLNIRAELADPYKNLVVDVPELDEKQRVATGMLVGLVIDPDWSPVKTVQVDLNRGGGDVAAGEYAEGEEEEEEDAVPTPWFVPTLAAGVVALAIAGGAYAYFSLYLSPAKDAELAEIEAEITTKKQQANAIGKSREELQALQQSKDVLESIVQHGMPYSATYRAVAESTPKDLLITNMVCTGDSVSITGNSADFSKVSHLAINLGGTKVLQDGIYIKAKRFKKAPPIVGYAINARIRPEVMSTPGIAGHEASPTGGGDNAAPDRVAAAAGRPKVIDFFATWCGPCKRLKPIMDEAEKKYGDKFEFLAVDIDDPANRSLVERYEVRSVPDVWFLDGEGRVVDRMRGFSGAQEVYASLEKLDKVAGRTETAN